MFNKWCKLNCVEMRRITGIKVIVWLIGATVLLLSLYYLLSPLAGLVGFVMTSLISLLNLSSNIEGTNTIF